jgi:hypothetical protein
MRKALVLGIALLVTSVVVLGGTVLRPQVAAVASSISNVFVTNDSSHPVPVREQNTDANGNIKVHEQGTANVNVTNNSLTVTPPTPVIDGGGALGFFGNNALQTGRGTVTATALTIHMTSGVHDMILWNGGVGGKAVAEFLGPANNFGNDSIVLDLAQPIAFDTVQCEDDSSSDSCGVSWVGAKP